MDVLKVMSSTQLHNNSRRSLLNLIFVSRRWCHEEKEAVPEEPRTCCMSGCANCVWLEYAEKLSQLYKDGGDKAMKEIKEKVTDPNMIAFLMLELANKEKEVKT